MYPDKIKCTCFLNVSVKELRNFMRKYYLIVELLIFKHKRQNISGFQCSDLSGGFFTFQQDNAPVHRACETMQLLTCETPDFIVAALWLANNPVLNLVDYQIGEAAGACVSQPYSWRWPRLIISISTKCSSIKQSGVVSMSSSLHSSTRRTFWTQTLVVFDICTDVHFDSHMSVQLPIVDPFLGVTSLNPL